MHPSSAQADMTWCAVVNDGIPGGYLNIRDKPSAASPVRYVVRPGDVLAIALGNHWAGTTAEDDWRLIENAYLRRGSGTTFDRVNTSDDYRPLGWARERYYTQVDCPDDPIIDLMGY